MFNKKVVQLKNALKAMNQSCQLTNFMAKYIPVR